MPVCYCLLNHQLTPMQISELENKWGYVSVVYPPESLSAAWSQVPVLEHIPDVFFTPFVQWLGAARAGDLVIIQGEFGSTFMLVDYVLRRGLVALHAVTKRIAAETREGETVRRQYVFEHVCFRKYEYWEDQSLI